MHCTIDTKPIVKVGVCTRKAYIGIINMRAEYACILNGIHNIYLLPIGALPQICEESAVACCAIGDCGNRNRQFDVQ